MNSFNQAIGKLAHNPYLQAFVAAVILATGVSEMIDSFGEGIGAHHGVALIGLWHFLKALAEIGESMEHLHKAAADEAAAE